MNGILEKDNTLDPSNWDSFRELGHQMLDDMLDHLSALDSKPAWQAMPQSVRDDLREPLPLVGQGEVAAYESFVRNVLPYPNGNIHPRYWGWVQGTGTPFAMLADMLASGLNPHMAGFNQAPAVVENQVMDWLKEMIGFPQSASGLLVSGGTMANITGLVVARNSKAEFDVRENGLQSVNASMVIYCSKETHSWVAKAAELLGLGRRSVRKIGVDENYKMDLSELENQIVLDRDAGYKPFCVVANAGTVNTGSTDNLKAIAQICRRENLWFHIDGAFGALAKLAPSAAHVVDGMELADSLAFDLHKWMYLPFEIACVLIKDEAAHLRSFSQKASYLAETERGVIAGGLPFAERGIELTRNFKALKVWMSLKAHGVEKFAQLIEQNLQQARYLARSVEQNPRLQLMAPVPLNVVCFRYHRAGVGRADLNALNEEMLLRLQESGIAVPSSTVIDGNFVLRVAIVNHRSKFSDFDLLLQSAVEIGDRLFAADTYIRNEERVSLMQGVVCSR